MPSQTHPVAGRGSALLLLRAAPRPCQLPCTKENSLTFSSELFPGSPRPAGTFPCSVPCPSPSHPSTPPTPGWEDQESWGTAPFCEPHQHQEPSHEGTGSTGKASALPKILPKARGMEISELGGRGIVNKGGQIKGLGAGSPQQAALPLFARAQMPSAYKKGNKPQKRNVHCCQTGRNAAGFVVRVRNVLSWVCGSEKLHLGFGTNHFPVLGLSACFDMHGERFSWHFCISRVDIQGLRSLLVPR